MSANTMYQGKSGQWAFIGHRVTGFLVLMFLLLHIVDVSLVNANPELYDQVHQLYGNVFLRIFEVGLLGGLLFHSLNGLRIILYDFFPNAIWKQKQMLFGVLFLTTVGTLAGGWVIMHPFFFGLDH